MVQIVHGFPPRETAGTEQYAFRLAEALRERGWFVHTLAATRAPGAAMYTVLREPGVTRFVNNAPYAGTRTGGRDASLRRLLSAELAALRPDVVHVQHLAFLDPDFDPGAPMVHTLHDAWGWCAAGGQLLRDGAPCEGPSRQCARCASEWVQDGPGLSAATVAAGVASRVVRADRLHTAWSKLPARLRALASRGAGPVGAVQIDARSANYRSFARRCAVRISPSRFFADLAEREGFGPVKVVPHGGPAQVARRGGGPFLFLGTLAPHKGPDLVVQAHAASGVSRPLVIHGSPGGDPTFAASLPHAGPLADVMPALAAAHALVLGSRWPENAPLVVLEARAAGCPVIAPRIGGLPELVEPGVDGWLYTPGSVAELSACIRAAEESPPLPVRPPPSFAEHVDTLVGVYQDLR